MVTDQKFNKFEEDLQLIEGKFEIGRFIVPFRIFGHNPISIICVNGAQQTMGIWRDLINRFKNDYRIVVFDFPGQGRAKVLSGNQIISFDEQMHVLNKVILALAPSGNNYLGGASWGSITAAGFAARYPHLVKKLVLGSFGSKLNDHILKLMREARDLIEKGDLASVGPLIVDGFGGNIPEALREAIRRQFQKISIEQARSFVAHINFVEDTASVVKVVNPTKIKAKTLMINGEKDTIIDPKDNKFFAEKIPDCEYRIIKNAGHFLHFEDPSIYDIYEEFFAI